MRFFTYSPLDMSEQEAFDKAKPGLQNGYIVHVGRLASYQSAIKPGQVPKADRNTYLVRVEPDDSLRVVDNRIS